MRKIKEFGNKLITWGSYGKLCLWSSIISMMIMVVYYIYLRIIKLPSFKRKEVKDTSNEM